MCLFGLQTLVMAQENDSIKQRLSQVNALNKKSVPFEQIKAGYNKERHFRSKADFPRELVKMQNGTTAICQTSNNTRVKALLAKLLSMSPVDFLLETRGIEGKIIIDPASPVTWVKKEDIPLLMKLTSVSDITLDIKQWDPLSNEQMPYADYFKTPMGINALGLINTYICGMFPSVTPSYESIKHWYESGKPKEDYKFVPFTPLIKEPTLPTDTSELSRLRSRLDSIRHSSSKH
jgi:hypothetical protein